MQHFLRFFWLLAFGIICFQISSAQKQYTINGFVQDGQTGEKLLSAKVFDKNSQKGTLTNNFGFFSLTLAEGPISLLVAYTGYQPFTLDFELNQDTEMTFDLDPYQTEVVEIIAENQQGIQDKTEMSTVDVSLEQIKLLPVLLGETDVIKAIQLLPGVQSGNEGSTGLYVRGGGPDQNLILLDDVPLYYVSHLGGFFSVFNADALSSVKIIKGGFPARYGGRLSSVLDLRMKEGHREEYHGEGSFGLVASRISLHGPIIKNKTTFMISGRRSFYDLLTRPASAIISSLASDGQDRGSFGYYFYDVNAKISHTISHKDRLLFSFYSGDDNLGISVQTREGIQNQPGYESILLQNENAWGNRLAALRWNHIWSPKMFSNLTATYTNYRLGIHNNISVESYNDALQQTDRIEALLNYDSGIRDYSLKLDFDYYPNPNHDLKYGGSVIHHRFTPGVASFRYDYLGQTILDSTLNSQLQDGVEAYVYLEDQFRLGNRFSGNVGFHATRYSTEGTSFYSFQPRISLRYLLAQKLSLKASYVDMTQFLHLLVNSGTGLPIDLWVPATDKVPPQRARQVAAGLAATLGDSQIEFSVEGYYKDMRGLITYKEGTDFYLGLDEGSWEERVEIDGRGQAYGVEVLLQKKYGKTTGWLGYTLSWNYRQFDNINQGQPFPFRYDRRHDVSLVLAHKFSERFSMSLTWVYGTGNSISLPSGGYAVVGNPNFNQFSQGGFLPYYIGSVLGNGGAQIFENGRNGFRMEPYHRLDMGWNWRKPTKWGEITFSIGVYNAYNRLNPYVYFLGTDEENPLPSGAARPAILKFSLFPIIPAPSLGFKF